MRASLAGVLVAQFCARLLRVQQLVARPITAAGLLRGGRLGVTSMCHPKSCFRSAQEFIGPVHGGWMFCFCRELCFRIEISVGAHAHYWRGMARTREWGGIGLLLLILCSIASSWFFAAGRRWNCAVGRVLVVLLLRPRWHAARWLPFTSRSGVLARTGRCTAGSPCWPARRCRRP